MSRYYDYDTLCKGMHDVVLKNGALHRCIDDIKILDLPTADVRENVKGEWIDFSMSIKGVPTEACGVCGEWSLGMGKNFCPNCGADMRGES